MDLQDEQAFRRLFDGDGVLRPGALACPERTAAFTVFAQRSDALLDLATIRAHGERFFGVKLGLTADKRYGSSPPQTDAARVVAASEDLPPGIRLCYGRPATEADRSAAETAERIQNTYGMALLAQRCATVWLVSLEARSSADDPVALTIAAVLASCLLGPILSPSGDELFGVRTARAKLDALRARSPGAGPG